MREIKFRIWGTDMLGAMKRMVYPRDLQETGLRAEFKDAVLMQYTGTKDKNGKEIWEDDIITNGKSNHLIYYNNEKCQFKADGYYSRSQDIPWDFTEEPYLIEVVGNIHENPELIK